MLYDNYSVPLYQQLYENLRDEIKAGEWPPGSRLPSERRMAANHGICRRTVRKALELLAQDGYVDAQHGRGYFVNRP